jgi:hypothetical protein
MVVKLEDAADRTDDPFLRRVGWGSGLVVSFDDSGRRGPGRSAVVATTSHVVRCGRPPCRYAIGFTNPKGSEVRYWTMRASLEESSPGTDLAFLTVEVPPQVSPSAPTLADPACHGDDLSQTITVGWPNLTLRTTWSVSPPTNAELVVKRYSTGTRVQYIGSYPLGRLGPDPSERVPIIFHNADLMPGSSGGPLLDEDGHVLGINSRILVPGDRPEKFNYCAEQADRHSPGKDCINMAISSQAIVEAFWEHFGDGLALEGCGGATDESPRRTVATGDEDTGSAPVMLTDTAEE